MGELVHIVTPLHTGTKREYLPRMTDDKVRCMEVARRYGREFWDGDRRFGYGGYVYDGRWEKVARALIESYALPPDARILDVGCGKGFLLYELKKLLPDCTVNGFDLSEYAIANAREEIKEELFIHRAQDPYPFEDNAFDLVLSLTTLHNLGPEELEPALMEMERVGKKGYLVVESFRNSSELFNLQCWALTCEAFLRPRGWRWIFEKSGYNGDFEFIYFE